MIGLFKLKNILTTLKAMVVGLVFSITYLFYMWLGQWIEASQGFGLVIMIVIVILSLLTWGWIANILWGWD